MLPVKYRAQKPISNIFVALVDNKNPSPNVSCINPTFKYNAYVTDKLTISTYVLAF